MGGGKERVFTVPARHDLPGGYNASGSQFPLSLGHCHQVTHRLSMAEPKGRQLLVLGLLLRSESSVPEDELL